VNLVTYSKFARIFYPSPSALGLRYSAMHLSMATGIIHLFPSKGLSSLVDVEDEKVQIENTDGTYECQRMVLMEDGGADFLE
jgi:hypothetical protein